MKVSTEVPFANECMVGKPVRIENRIVGKIVSVEGTKVVYDIHDKEAYQNLTKKEGFSMGTSNGGLYA